MAEQTPTQLDSPTERPVIGGKYVLEKLLGEGGYSWVYLASHKQIPDLEYVVKLLKPSHLSNDQVLRRFEQEATTLARLRSPRIVKIVDYGPTEAGIPYIVSEYINGVTLGHVLREHGSLSPWLTAHLGCQILEGMKDAHAAGVIHRDLKPDNVLITREEETEYPKAMLLDFGIAKVTEQASGDADATVEGLACSPRYAAPEVLTREPNPRSDLYAVGLVLAELITGKPVYRGSHNLILASEQLSSEKVPLPDEVLDTPLGPLIKKACDKQEKKRYRNANEMLEHLQSVRDSFAEDAKERASSEIDLSALVEKRDERPLSEAEQTALTANLHTYEQQFSGSGNLPSNIDQIVAAQQSSKVMRVLLPIVATLLIGTLGVLAWVIFRMQTSPDEDTASTVATAGEEPGSAEGNGNNAAANLESTFERAHQTVSNAINQASNNRISISTPVDDATLFYEGSEVSNLPMENVVTSNVRPLTFTVKADGYEDQELQIMQTGPVSLVAGMKEEGSSEPARVERNRAQRRQPVRRRPDPEPEPTPEPRQQQQQQQQGSDRLGDYLDNPFE